MKQTPPQHSAESLPTSWHNLTGNAAIPARVGDTSGKPGADELPPVVGINCLGTLYKLPDNLLTQMLPTFHF